MSMIRHSESIPTAEDFASQFGTPIIINTVNGQAYVLTDSAVIVALGHVGVYAPGASMTIETGQFATHVKRLTLTGSQRLTLEGTARMSVYN